jgi:SAM-dependent methyltransferase
VKPPARSPAAVDRELLYREMVELCNRHWWFRVHYRCLSDLVEPYLTGGRFIFDVGCGPGGASSQFSRSWERVFFDLNFRVLDSYIPRPVLRVQADAQRLPLGKNLADVVVCSDTLHQCSVRDVSAVVGELVRVCRPGGLVLLSEPAFDCLFGPHDDVEGGCRRFTRKRLEAALNQFPVEILRRTYLHPTAFLPALIIRKAQQIGGLQRTRLERHKTDLTVTNACLNYLFLVLGTCERFWLKRWEFPLGTSVAVVARKRA